MNQRVNVALRCAVSTVAAICLAVAGSSTASAMDRADGDFCELNVDTGRMVCYQTESELRARPSAAVTYIWARLFDWINHNPDGGYLQVTSTRTCTRWYTDNEHPMPDLGVWAYRNRISSIATSFTPNSFCDVKLYDGVNYGGDSSVWISTCANLTMCIDEIWDNKADSLKIS